MGQLKWSRREHGGGNDEGGEGHMTHLPNEYGAIMAPIHWQDETFKMSHSRLNTGQNSSDPYENSGI